MNSKYNYGGIHPKKVDGQWAIRTLLYQDLLRTKVKGLFDIKCPDDWDVDYLLNILCFGGYIAITDSPVGVQPFRSGLTGVNFRNQPTGVRIAVPNLPTMDRTFGVDCELLYFERMRNRTFFNYNSIVDAYSEKLASADASIDVSLMTSRLGYVIEAENEAQRKTILEVVDKITDGEPTVVYRKDTLSPKGMQIFFNNLKNNFIAGDVQDVKHAIMEEFLTLIGINNANTDKKERLITDEVQANNDEIKLNTSLFADNLERCCKKINNMFGIGFEMKFKFDSQTEGEVKKDDTSEHAESVGNSSSR